MLEEKIKKDMKEALRKGEKRKLSVLRLLVSVIRDKRKKKRYRLVKEGKSDPEKKSALKEEEVAQLVLSEIKKRKEAIEGFKKGDRSDLVQKEEKEIEILEEYLPQQLTKGEVEERAREVIKEEEAEGIKDMGRVMNKLMSEMRGKTEGAVVSEVVKDLLSS